MHTKTIALIAWGLVAITTAAETEALVSTMATKRGPKITVRVGEFTRTRVVPDGDDDGWCDLWCHIFKDQIAHRNKALDSDGDGLTDYAEMVLWRNPSVAEPMPRNPTPEELRAAAQAQEDNNARKLLHMAEVRKALEPSMHEVVVDHEGRPFSLERKRAERRQRLGQLSQALALKQEAGFEAGLAKAERLGLPEHFKLANGGTAVLTGEQNGFPTYTHTRSSVVAADTISTDELWPGGSSGLDLTGQSPQSPRVRIGVWEPRGLVIDHPEFAGNIQTVDSIDSTSGWTATGLGYLAFNSTATQYQEGSGCADLRKTAGSPTSVLYSRQQSTTYDFSERTLSVWYFIIDANSLASSNAVEIRFGSSADDYWSRSFDRLNIQSGWNLLSMRIETATATVGTPVPNACSYTGIVIDFVSTQVQTTGNGQGLDFWRLSDTRVTNMDRAASVDDHSTHTTGIMGSAGVNTDARGMAYLAEIQSRDSRNDLAEMAEIFSNETDSDDIFASNHSYGLNPGWTSFFVTQGANYPAYNANYQFLGYVQITPGLYSAWFANTAVSQQEDFLFGRYTDDLSGVIDAAVYGSDTLLPIWAAGNDRGDPTANPQFELHPTTGQIIVSTATRPVDGGNNGFDSMPPDSVSKNILTVGSIPDVVGGWTPSSNPQVSDFSSFGPTDDGRIKPDVCANGEGVTSAAYDDPEDAGDDNYEDLAGTSEAAPSVTGSIGLLVDLMRRYRGDSYQPAASLLKGLVIHTADDILNPGPDYQSGWGLVNAQSAAELVQSSQTTHQGQCVRMVLVENGSTVTIPVVATGGTPLKVTVCSTDPPGTEPAQTLDNDTLMLVNDFQLKVASSSLTHHPFVLDPDNPGSNATPGVNSFDNVEQVLISNPSSLQAFDIEISPASGETFVDDTGTPVPQQVAVLISGIKPDPALALRIISITQTGADKFTVVWPALVGTAYRVEESPDLTQNSWVDVTGDIVAQSSLVAKELTADPATVSERFWRVRKVE